MNDLRRIRISDLDLDILNFISDMKFASSELVRERFFADKGERYPKKRLKDFEDHGLLGSALEWGGRSFSYFITENGTKLLQRKGRDVVPYGLKGLDLKNYEHDKMLSQIRVRLEIQGKAKGWISERQIRNKKLSLRVSDNDQIIPDAYAQNVKGEDLIVELEVSRKSNERIKKLLKNYQMYFVGSKNEGEKVLFFFSNESLLKTYKDEYSKLKLTFPVRFILGEDLGLAKNLWGGKRSFTNV